LGKGGLTAYSKTQVHSLSPMTPEKKLERGDHSAFWVLFGRGLAGGSSFNMGGKLGKVLELFATESGEEESRAVSSRGQRSREGGNTIAIMAPGLRNRI